LLILFLKNLEQSQEKFEKDIWIPSFSKQYFIKEFPEITEAFTGEDKI